MNFAEEILFLKKKVNEEETESYLYANLWLIRTSRNETWSIGYFFNDGHLDSDELFKQLLIVLSSY